MPSVMSEALNFDTHCQNFCIIRVLWVNSQSIVWFDLVLLLFGDLCKQLCGDHQHIHRNTDIEDKFSAWPDYSESLSSLPLISLSDFQSQYSQHCSHSLKVFQTTSISKTGVLMLMCPHGSLASTSDRLETKEGKRIPNTPSTPPLS